MVGKAVVGKNVGLEIDGKNVGLEMVGCFVGFAVELLVGKAVGLRFGHGEGDLLGNSVGEETLGVEEGIIVGGKEIIFEGEIDGFLPHNNGTIYIIEQL